MHCLIRNQHQKVAMQMNHFAFLHLINVEFATANREFGWYKPFVLVLIAIHAHLPVDKLLLIALVALFPHLN